MMQIKFTTVNGNPGCRKITLDNFVSEDAPVPLQRWQGVVHPCCRGSQEPGGVHRVACCPRFQGRAHRHSLILGLYYNEHYSETHVVLGVACNPNTSTAQVKEAIAILRSRLDDMDDKMKANVLHRLQVLNG